MKKQTILTVLGTFLMAATPITTQAQETEEVIERNPAQIVQDRELIEKAKSKNYKGGAEEGELRVQAQLPKPQRKIAPVVDKREMEKENQDHD